MSSWMKLIGLTSRNTGVAFGDPLATRLIALARKAVFLSSTLVIGYTGSIWALIPFVLLPNLTASRRAKSSSQILTFSCHWMINCLCWSRRTTYTTSWHDFIFLHSFSYITSLNGNPPHSDNFSLKSFLKKLKVFHFIPSCAVYFISCTATINWCVPWSQNEIRHWMDVLKGLCLRLDWSAKIFGLKTQTWPRESKKGLTHNAMTPSDHTLQ
jgi:hypothetical protein